MENTQEKIYKHLEIKENADSLEFGSASKGGVIKIYGDFNKIAEFKEKIVKAAEIREYAKLQLKIE